MSRLEPSRAARIALAVLAGVLFYFALGRMPRGWRFGLY